LRQLTSVEKNARAMFVVVRHGPALLWEGRRSATVRLNHGTDELQTLRPRIHLSLLRWAGLYALSALRV